MRPKKKRKEKEGLPETFFRSFCVGLLLLGMGPSLKVVWTSIETPLENVNFSVANTYQLESFWVGVGVCVYFPACYWDPIWLRLVQALCMLPWSQKSSVCQACCVSTTCFLGIFHPLWLLRSFCPLFREVPWALTGRIWCWHPIQDRVFQSLLLSAQFPVVGLWLCCLLL